MSIRLTREQLLEVVGGEAAAPGDAAADLMFSGLEYDSRQIRGGELFLALKGEESHGHSYLEQAFSRGAAMALVEEKSVSSQVEEPERLVVVEDTQQAFWKLAGWWRKELGLPVVSITGSIGKTTVKEMTACLLLTRAQGMYPRKSFNNHVGLPYTVCGISRDHEWAVLEMGMNHAGEIKVLTEIARPNAAAIVNIRPVHTEFFKSIDEIADAKFEIIQGLAEGAPLILREDDEVLQAARKRHGVDEKYSVLSFGESSEADSRIENFTSRGFDGIAFDLVLGEERGPVEMGVIGKHNAINAACAALLARTVYPDLSLEEIAAGLSRFTAPLMRLNIKPFGKNKRIIDDCYNASPESMKAALRLMQDLCGEELSFGLVLGDMLELGSEAETHHQAVGDLAAAIAPAFVIGIGKFAELLTAPAQQAGIPAFVVDSPIAAAHTARKMKFDALLVKASRGIQLDKAVECLLELDE